MSQKPLNLLTFPVCVLMLFFGTNLLALLYKEWYYIRYTELRRKTNNSYIVSYVLGRCHLGVQKF